MAATAPIRPLARELPYATDVALKRKKKGSFIQVSLIYNVISAVQQSDSVIHVYILFPILFHYCYRILNIVPVLCSRTLFIHPIH